MPENTLKMLTMMISFVGIVRLQEKRKAEGCFCTVDENCVTKHNVLISSTEELNDFHVPLYLPWPNSLAESSCK